MANFQIPPLNILIAPYIFLGLKRIERHFLLVVSSSQTAIKQDQILFVCTSAFWALFQIF